MKLPIGLRLLTLVILASVILVGCGAVPNTVPAGQVVVQLKTDFKEDVDKYNVFTAGQTYPVELKPEPFLNVPAGFIAIRKDAGTVLEQGTYPKIPVSWVNGPMDATVPNGVVRYQLDADGNVTNVYPAGMIVKIDPKKLIESKALEVPDKMIAIGLKNGDIKTFGPYPSIPASTYRVVKAVDVPVNKIGLYKDREGKITLLRYGQYNLPADQVVFFDLGTLRFRLIREDLKKDPNACASYLCEGTLTGAAVKDTIVQASVDMDVIFHFLDDPARAEQLLALNDPQVAVQNYIGTPIRASRAISGKQDANSLQTIDGKASLENEYLTILRKATANIPLVIDSVSIRSLTVGDATYITRQQENQTALENQTLKAKQLANDLAMLSQQQELESKKRDFQRQQDKLDADAKAANLQKIFEIYGKMDWRTIWALERGGAIEPYLNPDGTLSAPPANVK